MKTRRARRRVHLFFLSLPVLRRSGDSCFSYRGMSDRPFGIHRGASISHDAAIFHAITSERPLGFTDGGGRTRL